MEGVEEIVIVFCGLLRGVVAAVTRGRGLLMEMVLV